MKVSVIIPALNEAENILACLQSVIAQPGEMEIIVVDGGSQDETAALASRHARVISGPRGRAVQMNLGASQADGEVLLFLHADTQLHPGSFEALRWVMGEEKTAGGTFTLQFDHPHPVLKFYALVTRCRWRYLHFGDQGIFVRRPVYAQMGGFQEIPLMEDLEFLLRLRRFGKTALIPRPITTSARRFLQKGVIRQEMLNIWLVVLYLVGVSPQHLARWYGFSNGNNPKKD